MLKYFKPIQCPLKKTTFPGENCHENVALSDRTNLPIPNFTNFKPGSTVTSPVRGSESSQKRDRSSDSDEERIREPGPPSKRLKPSQVCPDWRRIRSENLDCDYGRVYGRQSASRLLQDCERELTYFQSKELTRVEVFGKWHDIPRKQVAHGDSGLTYRYSGMNVPALPWTPLLSGIRDRIQEVTGVKFNFVLVNRYKDGKDYMGEHRDDEEDLVATSPIASLSLGQKRDFVFRHGESRGKHAKRNLPPVRLELEHGSLLVMKYPTNVFWYHSLPARKNAICARINMTFRCLKT